MTPALRAERVDVQAGRAANRWVGPEQADRQAQPVGPPRGPAAVRTRGWWARAAVVAPAAVVVRAPVAARSAVAVRR